MVVSYTQYIAAAAYGQDAYGSCAYDEACATTTTVNNPGNPATGLLQEPAFLIPAIALVAILIVVAEVAIRKALRKRRQAKLVS